MLDLKTRLSVLVWLIFSNLHRSVFSVYWCIILYVWCVSPVQAPSGVVRIDPLRFLAGCRTRWLNQHVLLYCCLLGPLFCNVSLRLYVFCLLVGLVKLSVLSEWLTRKAPLRKPFRGKEINSIKPQPKSNYDFFGLVYVLFRCLSCPPALHDISRTPMARHSLFVLKVPLNTN